ncbi:MAG: PAS domain-containing protein [Candidatus Omnitrophica bacterium]|nr:PAS domain-containing protein [Candidatus Omnitrophota bacterium]MDD5611179.1 PAS domain-containing protein [Candidatus Omnitrophota bacterium]
MEYKEKKKEQGIEDALEYAKHIINAVHIPLIILDESLKVVLISQSFCQVFKVRPEDTEGRFIYELGNRQWDIPKLRELLEDILPKTTSFDNFEVTHDFPDIGKRIMLVNARRIYLETNRTKLILLAIEDITEPKNILDALYEKIKQLEQSLKMEEGKGHTIVELKRKVEELQRRIIRK